MSVEPSAGPTHAISRERLLLTLAVPFALLLAASAVAWPWRSLGLPGVVGTLTPPSIALLAGAVASAMYALQRRLPLGMITWVPAGQGAIVLLTTGFISEQEHAVVGAAVIIAYVLIYLIVLGISLAVASQSATLAIAFVSFFVFTQATRFPLFGEDASVVVSGAGLLTLVALVRATLELALLVWLARRLMEAPEEGGRGVVVAIAALTAAHGLFAGWEDPVLRGEFSVLEVSEQTVRWLVLAGIQLGFAITLIRLRRSWAREPVWAMDANDARLAEEAASTPEDQPAPLADPPARSGQRGRRPTPRHRRRR